MGVSTIKIPRNGQITDSDQMKAIPDTPEHWETITIPEDIERVLLERNRHHFGQAEGTPFASSPLKAAIGYKADGYAAELILDGTFKTTQISEATSLFIQHLQTKTTQTLEGQITKDEVRNKLKRWKESTSTSPSGLHLGHYHCMWRAPDNSTDGGNREDVIDGQEMLLEAMVSLLNYALKHGYAYQRWTKVVNIMLQKDEGNPRIHRLRVIHIYEADYNLLLAVKWRQAMHHAEDHALLNDGLYGSRPGRSAIDPALIEVLQHEIYRMSMKSGINFDLDATSCYDRILTNVAAISSRRMGMNKQVTLLNSSTLEQAKYYLKTSIGISNSCYQNDPIHPIHGTGQGSGNSPSIWCFVCSALFDALSSQAHGARFTNYNNTDTLQTFIVGFVDDCAQRVNKFEAYDQPMAHTLIQVMESDAQLWNDLLWASGGALEQQKCSFHLIQSDWNKDGHPFLVGGSQGLHVNLTHRERRTPTKQLSNYRSHKSLGCLINPAHCHAQTWANIQRKNQEFAELLETNFFQTC